MQGLSEQISQTSELVNQIDLTDNISELRSLRPNARSLLVHSTETLNRIDEKIISLSITTTEDFAEEKGIILSDEITGSIETWKNGNNYLVIRKNGSFVSWKRI